MRTSPGLNYGSQYAGPGVKIFDTLNNQSIDELVLIFCFDMLIWNTDRQIHNSNLLRKGEELILIDHEMAFVFSKPVTFLGGRPDPWEFKNEPFARRHVFFSALKSKGDLINFNPFIDKLCELSDNIFGTMIDRIPDEWRTAEMDDLVAYLKRARDNANLMRRSLLEVLA